jgi:hypothetical protein
VASSLKILADRYIGEGTSADGTDTKISCLVCKYPWASWSVLKSLPSGTEARLLAPQLMRNSSAGLKVMPPADTMLGQESKGTRRTRRIAIGVDNKEGRKRFFFDAFNLFFSISIPPVGEGGMVRVRQKEGYQKGRFSIPLLWGWLTSFLLLFLDYKWRGRIDR